MTEGALNRIFKAMRFMDARYKAIEAERDKLTKALEEMTFAYVNKSKDKPLDFEIEALKLAKTVGTKRAMLLAYDALKKIGD